MDFVHVLNLLLWAIAAPSRTFSASIWSLAAQSSRRTAQSIFNHGDRFKSTFRKISESQQGASTSGGTELRIKTKKKDQLVATLVQHTLSPVLVHWESTYFFPVCILSILLYSCINSYWLRGFIVAVPAVQWRCTELHCAAQSRNAAKPFPNARTSKGIPAWHQNPPDAYDNLFLWMWKAKNLKPEKIETETQLIAWFYFVVKNCPVRLTLTGSKKGGLVILRIHPALVCSFGWYEIMFV